MPGYDTNRFVDLSPNEKLELTCGICQDILLCPVVTSCCLQSFCEDCINEWLKTNSICPYDRKPLTTDQLSRPPRALTNLLGKLKIKCDFHYNGCYSVIDLENLSKHTQQCERNPIKVCDKCFCDKAAHNCVEYLLDTINRMTIELNELKSFTPSVSTPLTITPNIGQNFNDKKIKVRKADMSREMQEFALNTALQALHKYNIKKQKIEIAKQITVEFNSKYGCDWNCIIGDGFACYLKYMPNHYIFFDYGSGVSVNIFKSPK